MSVFLTEHAKLRFCQRIGDSATDEEILADAEDALSRCTWKGRSVHALGALAVYVAVRNREGQAIIVTCLHKNTKALAKAGARGEVRKRTTKARRSRRAYENSKAGRIGTVAHLRRRVADAEWEHLVR